MTNWMDLEQLCTRQGIRWEVDAPLKDHCSFKIGGAADFFAAPASEEEIAQLLAAAEEAMIPRLVLGKGSNILFSDSGYRGMVLHLGTALSGMRLVDAFTVECESGATLIQLCRFALEHSLSGLEFAYGIPGSVGGAIYMNAGAYGGEMKDVLIRSRHVGSGGSGSFEGAAMDLRYRHSVYEEHPEYVITGGTFRLRRDDREAIRARMEDYMARRRSKQPLEYPSAGSTFKRPEGAYASALIDQCGLKGKRVGDAMVSEKHAGFVINAGNATGADVRELIARVQREVQEKTGYFLDCEVRIID